MIESPVLDEFAAEMTAKTLHSAILGILGKKYGPVPSDLAALVEGITDNKRLLHINELVALCPTIDEFQQKLGS